MIYIAFFSFSFVESRNSKWELQDIVKKLLTIKVWWVSFYYIWKRLYFPSHAYNITKKAENNKNYNRKVINNLFKEALNNPTKIFKL